MRRSVFTADQCREFEDAANPHSWLLTADLLHGQALALWNRRGQGILTLRAPNRPAVTWDETNKATFLLCAFALENAIKAFLVYEHPDWISSGYLHTPLCNHRLAELSDKSALIPYRRRNRWVLEAFEKGNESWMRYPCSRRANDVGIEPQFRDKLWDAYTRVMRGYGLKLMRLLGKGWKGHHGFEGSWKMSGEWLGAHASRNRP